MKIKILSVYLLTALFSANVFAHNPIKIPKKVYELFHNAFPEVKNESWYQFPDLYEAYFKNSDSSLSKIYYSRRGKLLSTIKYYSGNDLPLFIRTNLAKKYSGKNIFNVTEVYFDGKTVYYILLEDNERWYKVESNANGEIKSDDTILKAF